MTSVCRGNATDLGGQVCHGRNRLTAELPPSSNQPRLAAGTLTLGDQSLEAILQGLVGCSEHGGSIGFSYSTIVDCSPLRRSSRLLALVTASVPLKGRTYGRSWGASTKRSEHDSCCQHYIFDDDHISRSHCRHADRNVFSRRQAAATHGLRVDRALHHGLRWQVIFI